MYPKSKDVKEVYHVLISDKTVKHGDYYSFHKGTLTKKELKRNNMKSAALRFKEKGKYHNNLKHGNWTVYAAPRYGNYLSIYNEKLEEGLYANDKKVGIWKKYVEDGKVVEQFDFDNNQNLLPQINVGWKYPAKARKNRIEGRVRIKIEYDDCEPTNYQVVEDIGYGCDDAVIESLKEKRRLEKKYGVESAGCADGEEIFYVLFKLDP